MKNEPTVVYYKWAYSPSTDDVTLSHNHEGHPADTKVHEDMGAERSEHDLEYGYAYRTPHGWKLTTHDHHPLVDPHASLKVTQAIESVDA